MELDITSFFYNANPFEYSASRVERGENAGAITWNNAREAYPLHTLLTTDAEFDAFREHTGEFGAWSPEEIGSWDARDLNALLIQMISGDMRDYCDDAAEWDWEEYEHGCERGTYSSRLLRGTDGRVYYYLGS